MYFNEIMLQIQPPKIIFYLPVNTNKLNCIRFVFLAFVGTTAPFMAENRFSDTVIQKNVPFCLLSLKE